MIELVIELLITFFGESLLDLAAHALGRSDRAHQTLLRMIVFAVLGAIVGGVSLVLFPTHFIRDAGLRIASLVLTPLVVAAAFAWIGGRRERKGKHVSALEAFWPAYTFALAMAVVRYFGAG